MMSPPAILVVDDQSSNLIALEAVFDGESVELVKASSGQDALKLLLQRDFALVLLDVQMPGLDGFEVAEIMRSNPRTESTPIIFLTALSKEQRYIFRGYETGAVDYLFKPIEPEILRSKVRVFLELERKNRSLRQSLRLLQEERDSNQILLRSVGEGLLGVTKSGNIFYANPSAEKILGAEKNAVIGVRLDKIFSVAAGRENFNADAATWSFDALIERCAQGTHAERDDLFLQRNGEAFAIDFSANLLVADEHNLNAMSGVVVVFRDASARRPVLGKPVVPVVENDALTGLDSREIFTRKLSEKVAEANRRETSLAVLYIDLDGFKSINEKRGRDAGDIVLRAAADRLRESAREGDLVARYGDDEFVMVLESSEPRRTASLISGKILQAFARVVDLGGEKIQVSLSIGISIYPDDSTQEKELITCAEQAMYQAKSAGRSNYRFYRG